MRTKVMSAAAFAAIASISTANTATAQDCPTTTAEENVSIVEQYIQEVTAGDVAAAEEVVDDDFEHNLSRGGIEVGDLSAGTLVERAPDVTVHDIFGSGENVAVRYSFPVSGDAVEGAPSDASAEVTAIAIARVECGEIQEVWIEHDDFGLALAMGMQLQTAE